MSITLPSTRRLYGSETWTFRRTDESRLEVSEMRFLWYVAVHTRTVWDKERRCKIRSQLEARSWTNTQNEERLAGTSIEDVVRKSFQATRNINR
jgi:hypothetical protein